MSSRLSFDFTALSEQIAAAVRSSVETVLTQQRSAAFAPHYTGVGRATTYDIRALIVANAEIIWPICGNIPVPDPKVCFSNGRVMPSFSVVVTGHKSKGHWASVVHGGGDGTGTRIFFRAGPADTVESALHMLLESTTIYIDLYETQIFAGPCTSEYKKGDGWYQNGERI